MTAGAPGGPPLQEPFVTRQLFGGALSASLPARLLDLSDLRQVPDNQEAWADTAVDQALIIEILEYVPGYESDPEGAVRYLFEDLARAAGAAASSCQAVALLTPADTPGLGGAYAGAIVIGSQAIAKEREGHEAANVVQVAVANVRLPHVGTDLLLVLNTPTAVSPLSSTAALTGPGAVVHTGGPPETILRRALASLAVHDWGLFG